MAVTERLNVSVQGVLARFCYGGNLNLAVVEMWTNGIAQAYGFFLREGESERQFTLSFSFQIP
jgi:hypothetical protein